MSIKWMVDKFLEVNPVKQRMESLIFLIMPMLLLVLLWVTMPKAMKCFLNSAVGTLFFILYTILLLGWIIMDKRIKKYKRH